MSDLSSDTCSLLHALVQDYPLATEKPFKNTLLIGIQHILATTVDMLKVMQSLGLEYAVIGGKNYSTHEESASDIEQLGFVCFSNSPQLCYGHFDDCMQDTFYSIRSAVLEILQKRSFKSIIVLDDGGDLLRTIPSLLCYQNNEGANEVSPLLSSVIGVEQTKSGTTHPAFKSIPYPIINVAGAFAKTYIEYPFVAEIIVGKILDLIYESIIPKLNRFPVIGVVGCGVMGSAVLKILNKTDRFHLIIHEKDTGKRKVYKNAIYYDHLSILMANADIVIGCTGQDITANDEVLSALLHSQQDKWLVSTGSKDSEFNSLLKVVQQHTKHVGRITHPSEDIAYKNVMGSQLHIIRGGFPINFTNGPHSVPPEYIWPTRAALLFACISAATMTCPQKAGSYQLSSKAQLLILKKFIALNPDNLVFKKMAGLSDDQLLSIILRYSSGELLPVDSEQTVMVTE